VDMDVICISETWYKGWHTNKRICIPRYRVVQADKKGGKNGGGVVMFINSNLKFKVWARSPDVCLINYLFVEIKYYGHNVLACLVYNPSRINGLSLYTTILEDLCPKYENTIFFGDINTNLMMPSERSTRQIMEWMSLSIVATTYFNRHF
jgi:hypothetical protein